MAADLRRHWRHFAAASVGIVIGVASLTFFLALGFQVRGLLLGQVFPSDLLEVAPASSDIDIFALRLDLGRDALGEADLEALAALEGVEAVYPKMRLTVPAMASGGTSLFGAGMQTEIVADGIDPELVDGDASPAFVPVVRDGTAVSCREDASCGEGLYCERGGFGPGVCRPFIPVLVSPYVIELYNGAFRRAYNLPKINPAALTGMVFEMSFGASSFRPSTQPPIVERMRLAGVSERAIPLGVTIPLGEVRRLNGLLDSPEAGERFHSAIIKLNSAKALPSVVQAVEERGLSVRDRGARRAALVTAVVVFAVGLVGVVLLAISAAHIMHVFYLVVMIRRRELGLLRAVGATRNDVKALLILESAVVGLLAATVGVAIAWMAARVADIVAATQVPDFPFKPESFFALSPLLMGSVVVATVAICVVAALPPALRAVNGDPSEALSGR